MKVREYRSKRTHIRERVYVYAGLGASPPDEYLECGLNREELLTGYLIGTVEVVDCKKVHAETEAGKPLFAYVLANPRRLPKPLKPENRPQPIWFRPFGASGPE